MTYIVTEACIKCKYMDCIEVCPVDCFYEGENMLVIHPDECIDCGVCEPECPVDCFYEGENMLVIHPDECIDCGVCEPECPVEAILPDTEGDVSKWVEFNRDYSEQWPNITRMGTPPADADEWAGVADKMKHFSPKPAPSEDG